MGIVSMGTIISVSSLNSLRVCVCVLNCNPFTVAQAVRSNLSLGGHRWFLLLSHVFTK